MNHYCGTLLFWDIKIMNCDNKNITEKKDDEEFVLIINFTFRILFSLSEEAS